jgi:hypothetical protein
VQLRQPTDSMEQNPAEAGTHLVKTFLTFYGIRRYITVFRRARQIPRPCVTFRNRPFFYGDELLAPRRTPKLEDHPLSAVRDCLFSIVAAIHNIWKPFP